MATITLYELSSYNNGRLLSHTFNIDPMDSRADWLEAIQDWMDELTSELGRLAEEWIVADFEGIPEAFVGEYDIAPDYWCYKGVMTDSYLDPDVFEAAMDLGLEADMVEELYQGKYDDDEDFAYEFASDLGLLTGNDNWPTSHIDWLAAARELMMDFGESGRHYFRTTY